MQNQDQDQQTGITPAALVAMLSFMESGKSKDLENFIAGGVEYIMKDNKLESIGFYTLNENRVRQTSLLSPLWRCEIVLTDRCNFKCPYCRGLKKELQGDISLFSAQSIINYWANEGLKNIRLSGGEPTLHKDILEIVEYTHNRKIERIAISTNGYSDLNLYLKLIEAGVNDFSISLDACCSSTGYKMCGRKGAWERVINNIKELSKLTYVTLGVVVTEETVNSLADTISFGISLGVSDIRIISSAQYNQILPVIKNIPKESYDHMPILKYRLNNLQKNITVRGLAKENSDKCALVLDDMIVAGIYHFPCVIYMREGGNPIGKVNGNLREERYEWFKIHNNYEDNICRVNCLDVCREYNDKYRKYHKGSEEKSE